MTMLVSIYTLLEGRYPPRGTYHEELEMVCRYFDIDDLWRVIDVLLRRKEDPRFLIAKPVSSFSSLLHNGHVFPGMKGAVLFTHLSQIQLQCLLERWGTPLSHENVHPNRTLSMLARNLLARTLA